MFWFFLFWLPSAKKIKSPVPVSLPTCRAGMSKVLMEKLVRVGAMWLLHGKANSAPSPGVPKCSEKAMESGESMLGCHMCSFSGNYAYRKAKILHAAHTCTLWGLYQELGDGQCGKAFLSIDLPPASGGR